MKILFCDPFDDLVLCKKNLTNKDLVELVDCLIANPNEVTNVFLWGNKLTDETGVKLAQYVAASSTIRMLSLSHNQFGSETYLAMASAMRVNSSLKSLLLFQNPEVDRKLVESAFVEALRINPTRPRKSQWWFSESWTNDFDRLKTVADELGHPTLQQILLVKCDRAVSFRKHK